MKETSIRPHLDVQPGEEPPHETCRLLHNLLQATEIFEIALLCSAIAAGVEQHSSRL